MLATPGPIEAEYEPGTGSARRIEVTSAQLHGHACVVCGSELDGLTEAGFVYTPAEDAGRLGWPVKACPQHAGPIPEAAA